MKEQEMKTVLLTGASTGLGLALAKLLLPMTSYRLVLTARESSLVRFAQEGIEESERVWLRALDVRDREQQDQVVSEIEAHWGGVDILINNAGIAYRAVVEHVTEDELLAQMDINFRAPMALAKRVMPGMREKRAGRIINVSSAAGMMAMPTMAAYSASKFALEGATESLMYEARPWGIKVSLIQPGFIRSTSFKNVRFTEGSCQSMKAGTEAYSRYYRYMEPFISKLMGMTWATPERVAKRIIRTMTQSRPAFRIRATPDVWLFMFMRRFLPQRLYHMMLYYGLPHIGEWVPKAAEQPLPLADNKGGATPGTRKRGALLR